MSTPNPVQTQKGSGGVSALFHLSVDATVCRFSFYIPSIPSTDSLASASRLQARQSATPPPPCTASTVTTGYIAVSYTNTAAVDGYVGKIDQVGDLTMAASTADAHHVSILGCPPEGPVEITILVGT